MRTCLIAKFDILRTLADFSKKKRNALYFFYKKMSKSDI